MPRAHFTKAVVRRVSGAPADGTFEVYKADGTALTQPIYAADTGVTTLTNPVPFANGIVDFFLDTPERVRLVITPSGSLAQTFDNVDVPEPAGLNTIRIPHTWHIPGDVKVASGDTDYILPFFVPVPPGQTARVRAAQTTMRSGTSATLAIRRQPVAGGALVDISGLESVPVGIGAGGGTATDTANTLSNADHLYCVVTAVSGAPKNMTVTVYIDYTSL